MQCRIDGAYRATRLYVLPALCKRVAHLLLSTEESLEFASYESPDNRQRLWMGQRIAVAGADPNTKDDIEDSTFLYAGAEGLDQILLATIDHGADVASINRYGGTALIPASEHGHVSTVKILIDAGVPVDHINKLSWTALHEAIVLGTGSPDHIETVRLLIEAGADVTIPDGAGVSPKDLAVSRGYQEIVDLIEAALEG